MEAGKRMLNRALVTNGRRMVAGSECQVRRTATAKCSACCQTHVGETNTSSRKLMLKKGHRDKADEDR